MQVRREGVRAVEVVVALVPEEGVGGGGGQGGGLNAGGQGIVGRGVRGGRLRGGLKRDAGLVKDGERELRRGEGGRARLAGADRPGRGVVVLRHVLWCGGVCREAEGRKVLGLKGSTAAARPAEKDNDVADMCCERWAWLEGS